MLKQYFSVGELVKLTGLSRHMVNYLCRYELLLPESRITRKRGIKRQFSLAELLVARAISRLLASGVSVLNIRDALNTLRKKLRAESPRDSFCRYVVIEGKTAYLHRPNEPIVNLNASGQLAFHFVLDSAGIGTKQTNKLKKGVISVTQKRAA